MNTAAKILFTALLLASCANLKARFVTLTVNRNVSSGPIKLLAELTIQSNEVASVRSSIGYFYVNIIKDGITAPVVGSTGAEPGTILIAGPAVFQVTPVTLTDVGVCTIEISPESFPPDKTL